MGRRGTPNAPYGVLVTESDWPSYLRALMRAKGITTDRQLAEKTGIDRSVISQWKNDKAQPTIPSLQKLWKAFGLLPVDVLVAAGLITKEDARLKEHPKPPEPVTVDEVEEEIRAAGLPPEIEKALLQAREANRAQIRAQIKAMRVSGLLDGSGPHVNSA